MGLAKSLFHSSDVEAQTLHRLIMPSEEQRTFQQERWHKLSEFLVPWLEARTQRTVRWWLQGSYKFGTQVRPRRSEEFDIDFGLYVEWPGSANSGPPASLLKNLLQQGLIEYSSLNPDVNEIASPKERCCRVVYSDHFHIDVPIYHLEPSLEIRSLATETNGWESSDPKALVKWFLQNAGEDDERNQLRRVIRYLKCWANLTFKQEERPSSILLTVMATKAYKSLPSAITDDDDVLVAVVKQIYKQLQQSSEVLNPVDSDENLNRMSDKDWRFFSEQFESLQAKSIAAIQMSSLLEAADAWAGIFDYFFPLPENLFSEQRGSQLPAVIQPTIRIFARDQKGQGKDFHGTNQIVTLPKNYDVHFRIEGNLPHGVTAHWTVRNRGVEAELENDLGHRCSVGISVVEKTRYNGTHFMDCMLKDANGRILGVRRISVQIFDGIRRNQPKPGYIRARSSSR